jgi:hypothetical protein
VELFASMGDEYVDYMSDNLDTPYSKIEEFKLNYQNPAQRKEAYLDYYVHNYPVASWTKITGLLRLCALPQQAAVVENTYIQGTCMLSYKLLNLLTLDAHVPKGLQ